MGKRKNAKETINKEIIEAIKEFKTKIKADKIILFGSYASGKVNKNSDIDLILVSKKFEGKKFHSRFKGLWLKWTLDLPVDFVPYTPHEFGKLSREISIVSEALKKGIEI